MKLSSTILLLLPATTTALTTNTNRRSFLNQASSNLAVLTLSAPVALAASDPYALDVGDAVVVPKKESDGANAGKGGAVVGGALAGGLALSLPFFLPNLLRMAGVNNAKNPTKK